jgi:hypothetical protein
MVNGTEVEAGAWGCLTNPHPETGNITKCYTSPVCCLFARAASVIATGTELSSGAGSRVCVCVIIRKCLSLWKTQKICFPVCQSPPQDPILPFTHWHPIYLTFH